jgi:outer membrane biosynthesis protein TonB
MKKLLQQKHWLAWKRQAMHSVKPEAAPPKPTPVEPAPPPAPIVVPGPMPAPAAPKEKAKPKAPSAAPAPTPSAPPGAQKPTAEPAEIPGGTPGLVVGALNDAGITSPKAHANVLATVKAESNFKVKSENLNYYRKLDGIQKIFGKRRMDLLKKLHNNSLWK